MVRALSKKLYVSALTLVGADRVRVGRLLSSGKAAVLNFHRVSPDENPFWPPMKPEVFDEFCGWLSRVFDVRQLRDVGRAVEEKPIAVLSFDDGYHDFVEYALPIMEKHGLTGNLNVIPQCAETGQPIWNVRLYDFLRAADLNTVAKIKLPSFDASLSENSLGAKLRYGLAISRFLKNRPRAEREKLWENIEPLLKEAGTEGTRMLSTSELADLPDSVELGVHSYSHESMGFESDEFFENDLVSCRTYFAEKLNRPMTIYAFPNGSYRRSQIELLRSNGVKHILLVDEEFAQPTSDVLPRRTMYGDSLNEVKMHSLGY